MRLPFKIAARTGRSMLLMMFAAAGTILLVRLAPGFFSDIREMDAKYALVARSEMQAEGGQQSSRGNRESAQRKNKDWPLTV